MIDKIDAAWQEVLEEVDGEFDRVIEDPNAFSGAGYVNQDIVDTGNLRDSKETTIEENKLTSQWDARDPETGYPYGTLVQKGGFFGKTYKPGRDWPEEAMRRVDPAAALADKLNKMGIKAKVKFSRFN